MSADAGIPKRLQKASLGFIANPKGKRSLYYMSIMKEAHTKMRKDGESDEAFKKRFTAERSRQFDFLMSEGRWLLGEVRRVATTRVPVNTS